MIESIEMIEIPIDYLILFLMSIALMTVAVLSIFYDHKEGCYYASRCVRSLFYCKKCHFVSSVSGEVEFHNCPKCGAQQGRLKF